MKRAIACLLLVASLAACGGIPLRSMPRLMNLQTQLLDANPSEFMVAIQVDKRMTPPAGAAPTLRLAIWPREPGAFEAVDKTLPLRLTEASATALGLAPASADRRWLIYSFPAEAQADLTRIQDDFKRLQVERRGAAPHGARGGGSVAVGISQQGVAAKDPALADTRWESWLQTSRREGFFELWSGSIAALLEQAKAEAAPAPSSKPN